MDHYENSRDREWENTNYNLRKEVSALRQRVEDLTRERDAFREWAEARVEADNARISQLEEGLEDIATACKRVRDTEPYGTDYSIRLKVERMAHSLLEDKRGDDNER